MNIGEKFNVLPSKNKVVDEKKPDEKQQFFKKKKQARKGFRTLSAS